MSNVTGTFGTLRFVVTRRRQLSYSEVDEEASGRWGVHDRINGRPMTQFIAPGQRMVTLTVQMSRSMGINPDTHYRRAVRMARNGRRHPLILGGRPVSSTRYYIENVQSVSEKFAPGRGQIMHREVIITFMEYR